MKPLIIHPLAQTELEAEVDYYLENGLLVPADDFKAEIDAALDEIQESPTRWRLADAETHPGIRTYGPTRKFKYRIGYLEEEKTIQILACYFSGDEDPLRWMERAAA